MSVKHGRPWGKAGGTATWGPKNLSKNQGPFSIEAMYILYSILFLVITQHDILYEHLDTSPPIPSPSQRQVDHLRRDYELFYLQFKVLGQVRITVSICSLEIMCWSPVPRKMESRHKLDIRVCNKDLYAKPTTTLSHRRGNVCIIVVEFVAWLKAISFKLTGHLSQ